MSSRRRFFRGGAAALGSPGGSPGRFRGEYDDNGFSLVELLVTLLVVAIVIPLAFGLVTNLLQQSQNVHDTIVGVQQDQTAGEALIQYLHGTTLILPGSSATTLDASILAGVNSTSTPQSATLQAVLTNSTAPGLDAVFTTSLTPSGGPTSSIGTYDALDSTASTPVFTYYYNASSTTSTTTASTTTSSTPAGLASTNTPTNAELPLIVAVGVDVTFLAGPHVPTEGFQATHPTSFQTTVYLQNSSGVPAPSSSTSLVKTGTVKINSQLTLTATVSPVPDGGTVTFAVDQGGTPLSVCPTPVPVATTTGNAVCTFTPASGGQYHASASFSGTAKYQASTSTLLTIVVPIATTTSITSVAGGVGTLTIPATVSPSAATGTVSFTIHRNGCSSCTTFRGSAQLAGGSATYFQSGLAQNQLFNVTATYGGDPNYAPSPTVTSSGSTT